MNTKKISGIDSDHLIRSALYFLIGVVMMFSSFPAGFLKGAGLGGFLFYIGLILCIYELLRPWANAKNYLIQFAVLFAIFAVLWLICKSREA